MGSIYRRAGSANLWLKYYDSGRACRVSARTSDRTEAKRKLAKIEGDLAAGKRVSPQLDRLTLADACADLLADSRCKGNTSTDATERRVRLHLLPYFGATRRLVTITESSVRAYIAARLDAKARPATINRELAALARLLRLSRVPDPPRFEKLAEHNARCSFVERDQLDAITGHLPAVLADVVRFAAFCGWRVKSEILPLTWAQVDWSAGVVRIAPGLTKGREARELPFAEGDPIGTILRARQQAQRELRAKGRLAPWVFVREDGGKVEDFRGAWQAACTAAGAPGKLLHDLRRTAVRSMIRAGIPEKVAMTLTGHRTRSIFERYHIVDEHDRRDATAKLAEYLTGTVSGTGDAAAASGGSRK